MLVDCGDVLDTREESSMFMLTTMDLMRYDALNLGAADFQFGHEFLKQMRKEISFAYISSNLLYRDATPPWVSNYVIKDVGGMKIGLLGVVAPDDLSYFLSPEDAKVIRAEPPEDALNRLIPEVREKADMIVLMCQLSTKKLLALLNTVKGIDVALTSGPEMHLDEKPPEGTVLFHTGTRGKALGTLKIGMDDRHALQVLEAEDIRMVCSVPDDKEMAVLVDGQKQLRDRIKMERDQEKIMKELEMTPQEFMERYRQEQMKKGGAR